MIEFIMQSIVLFYVVGFFINILIFLVGVKVMGGKLLDLEPKVALAIIVVSTFWPLWVKQYIEKRR